MIRTAGKFVRAGWIIIGGCAVLIAAAGLTRFGRAGSTSEGGALLTLYPIIATAFW